MIDYSSCLVGLSDSESLDAGRMETILTLVFMDKRVVACLFSLTFADCLDERDEKVEDRHLGGLGLLQCRQVQGPIGEPCQCLRNLLPRQGGPPFVEYRTQASEGSAR